MTAPAGGTAFVLGAGIVSVVNKYSQVDSTLVHEATSGTLEMVRKLMAGEKQKKPMIALFGAPEAWDAFKGIREYKGKAFKDLRGICFNQDFSLYLVASKKSGIRSYSDLKGKRVAIGGPGSTVATTALLILNDYHITKKDFKVMYYNYGEAMEGIVDGSLDAGFIGGAFPVAAFTEISTTHDVRLIPVDEPILNKIIKEYPGHVKAVVKAKSYRGVEQDTQLLGWSGGVWTHEAMPDALVYNFLKTLFSHFPDYYAVHASAKNLSAETATRGISVPLHPGAEKYFRQVGIVK